MDGLFPAVYNLLYFLLVQAKRWSRCTLTSVCSACGKAVSTRSCWITTTSCDVDPASVGFSAGYLTSEPTSRWQERWLKGPLERLLDRLCGWAGSSERRRWVLFPPLLKRQCGPVDSASGVPFLPYPFSVSAYLSEKTEKRDEKRVEGCGTCHPSLNVSEDAK